MSFVDKLRKELETKLPTVGSASPKPAPILETEEKLSTGGLLIGGLNFN